MAETLDEFVRSRRHDLEVVAMLESISDQKGIIALALLRGADGNARFASIRRTARLLKRNNSSEPYLNKRFGDGTTIHLVRITDADDFRME